MSNEFIISVGLLWEETLIHGELTGKFLVELTTAEGRPEHFAAQGGFSISAVSTQRPFRRGIRLAESLTPQHAEKIIHTVHAQRPDLNLEVIVAGREWPLEDKFLDCRVWWTVVKVHRDIDVYRVLNEVRDLKNISTQGFTVIHMDKSSPRAGFALDLENLTRHAAKISFKPSSPDASFKLHQVPIGRGFHWEHKETLEYRGELLIFHNGSGLTAINRLPLETYLESTVSSEMRSDLPAAFSQAQAIAARSTVLATAGRHHYSDGFDVCNDDHCQCYQGIVRESQNVITPIRETSGQVLLSENRVVDARYAKSCGGVSERYEAAWGEEGPNYFAVRACGDFAVPDLTNEIEAKKFVLSDPPVWCNGDLFPYPEPWDKDPLYRWQKTHTRTEWGKIVEQKTGRQIGALRELRVIERAKSGRITILDIVGESGALRAYGELNIRRALSESHLPSSFFIYEATPQNITLFGGGWGHGVGMCQLGAAAMAKEGWSLEQILEHYYPNSELKKI